MTTQSKELEEFRRYTTEFITKQKDHCKDHCICDEDLLIDLIRLEDKLKKAFLIGMPSVAVERVNTK